MKVFKKRMFFDPPRTKSNFPQPPSYIAPQHLPIHTKETIFKSLLSGSLQSKGIMLPDHVQVKDDYLLCPSNRNTETELKNGDRRGVTMLTSACSNNETIINNGGGGPDPRYERFFSPAPKRRQSDHNNSL
jgi:hypothetical protein